MENTTLKYLTALKSINMALLQGLKLAAYMLENVDALTPQQRDSNVQALKKLIAQSEKVFDNVPEGNGTNIEH